MATKELTIQIIFFHENCVVLGNPDPDVREANSPPRMLEANTTAVVTNVDFADTLAEIVLAHQKKQKIPTYLLPFMYGFAWCVVFGG